MSKDDYCLNCCPDMSLALPRTSTLESLPEMATEAIMDVDQDKYHNFKAYLEKDRPDRRYQLHGTKKNVRGIVSGHLVQPKSQPRTPAKFDAMKELREFIRARTHANKTVDTNSTLGIINKDCHDTQSTWRERGESKDFWETQLASRIGRYFASLRVRVSRTMARCRKGLLLRGKPPIVEMDELVVTPNMKFSCTDITINDREYVNIDLL